MLNTAPHEELTSLIADVYSVLERVQAGASTEEIELRVAAAQVTIDKLQEIVGAGPTGAFNDLTRHLHFIVHYHRKNQPDNYASDLVGIRERDLPDVIKLVGTWGAPTYDPVLLAAVRVSWEAQHYASAVRDAFIVLEMRLRDLVDAEPGVAASGVRLVTAVLGPTSSTRVALPTDTFMGKLTGPEAEGAYALVKGAFQLFRNATAHRPIVYQRQQGEDVIRLVNLCLMLLPRPVGEDRSR